MGLGCAIEVKAGGWAGQAGLRTGVLDGQGAGGGDGVGLQQDGGGYERQRGDGRHVQQQVHAVDGLPPLR